jgi:hypothetical protein
VVTHYCALGNQPRFRLTAADPDTLRFDFAGGSNLDANKDAHVHAGAIKFLGKDRITSEWEHYSDGKPAGKCAMKLIRKK